MRIKAHQTTYAGVKFRSRLEAKWAAYFDMIGVQWDYEPCDLEGWVPDFCLRVEGGGPIYVEVKPVQLVERKDPKGWELPEDASFEKARLHNGDVWVLLLGERPQGDADFFGIGTLFDAPKTELFSKWIDTNNRLAPADFEAKWRAACNATAWCPA